jgi:hypothetical protein
MCVGGLLYEMAHHKRRSRLSPLLAQVKACGLTPVRAYYFNFFLFAPIWLARRIIHLFAVKLDSENEVNSPLVNRILTAIFGLDCALAPHVKVPFGVSCLVIARKS